MILVSVSYIIAAGLGVLSHSILGSGSCSAFGAEGTLLYAAPGARTICVSRSLSSSSTILPRTRVTLDHMVKLTGLAPNFGPISKL
jgi:hypothetical protein